MTPCWWAYSMASATRRISSAASRGGSGPSASALREALAFDEAHREKMLALVLADLEDRHDAWMVEVGGGLGLGVEAFDVGLVGELAGEDHLERDGPVQADLPAWKTTPMPPRAISRMIS